MPSTNGKKSGQKRRRPSPPPPPPKALIELLRSDPQVLEYFTSLQSNLEADVQKWKDRAEHYKKECQDLKTKVKQRKTKASASLRKKQVKHAGKSPRKEKEKESHSTPSEFRNEDVSIAAAVSQVPVDDSMFNFSSDDDDDDSCDMHGQVTQKETGQDSQVGMDDVKKPQTSRYLNACERLCEARDILQSLGVAVVEEEATDEPKHESKEYEDSQGDGQAGTFMLPDDDQTKPIRKLRRRSDQEVASDLMQAFHTLTRLQLHMDNMTLCPPFSKRSFVPCCDDTVDRDSSHPAAKGKQSALRALVAMDQYCTPMNDDEWESLFPQKPEKEEVAIEIRVGMRDRRLLVDNLLSSLSGEISAWVVADRSSRLISTALHYQIPNGGDQIDHSESLGDEVGSKSQARLSSLAERCLLAQIVSGIHYNRDGIQDITGLVWKYILSAVPSLGAEDYPRLPPVLNLCVLEALLCHDENFYTVSGSSASRPQKLYSSRDNTSSLLVRAFALAIHTTAQVWKIRLSSSDDRISNMSRVEVSCYERMIKTHRLSLFIPSDETGLDVYRHEAEVLLNDVLSHAQSLQVGSTSNAKFEASVALQLALIIIGDPTTLSDAFEKAKSTTGFDKSVTWLPCAFCSAFKQLQVRQSNTFRQGALMTSSHDSLPDPFSNKVKSYFNGVVGAKGLSPDLFGSIVSCCIQLSDAEYLHQLVLAFLKQEIRKAEREEFITVISKCLGSPFSVVPSPTVRVVNLKRRRDRMRSFMAQAHYESILVAKAVASLDGDTSVSPDNNDSGRLWGLHAFDGKGRASEVESRLSTYIGKGQELSSYVEAHWRPNDLKAFDKDARNDKALVRLSPSETACALSHIGSWKGVCRSLTIPEGVSGRVSNEKFLLSFKISGHARGEALLDTNDHMPPTPVCVILEDDAILVDRFLDRLEALLEELPRDFHFCSLGYSRPKTAPMTKYSSQLGIPSCIWYLTGYILSLEGARHLLNSLPVRGPVDSWIGLKMSANWDNPFGSSSVVGAASPELPARKDLAQMLQFRAFCALVPLCSQKVGISSNVATAGRSWRQRDTDVTYSGNL